MNLNCEKISGVICGVQDEMYILSGVFNIIAAILFAWWSLGAINNILLILDILFLAVGCNRFTTRGESWV